MLEINKQRGYFHDITKAMINKEALPVREIHQMGARWCGKTFDFAVIGTKWLFLTDANGDPINVAIVGARQQVGDADELYTQYSDTIEQMGLTDYTTQNITKRRIKAGKSQMRVVGTATRGGRVAKTGLSAFLEAHYIIIHLEEAYEFSLAEVQAIEEAVRGGTKLISTLIVYTSNPWTITNHYVKRMNKKMRFKEKILKDKGQQFLFEKDSRTIYHYMNWRILPPGLMNQDRHDQIKRAYELDPRRAKIIDIGTPGLSGDTLYSAEYERSLLPAFNTNRVYRHFIGGDYGDGMTKGGGKTTIIIGKGSLQQGIDIVAEYAYSRSESKEWINGVERAVANKTSLEQARDIVLFLKHYASTTRMPERTTVHFESAEATFIDVLNSEAKIYGISKRFVFEPCVKYPINDRIRLVQHGLVTGWLRINKKKVAILDEDLSLCSLIEVTSDKRKEKKERMGIYTHALDALEYALEDLTYDYLEQNRMDVNLFKKHI